MQSFDYDKNYQYVITIKHLPTGEVMKSAVLTQDGLTMEKIWQIVETQHTNITNLPFLLKATGSGSIKKMSVPAPILHESTITISYTELDK